MRGVGREVDGFCDQLLDQIDVAGKPGSLRPAGRKRPDQSYVAGLCDCDPGVGQAVPPPGLAPADLQSSDDVVGYRAEGGWPIWPGCRRTCLVFGVDPCPPFQRDRGQRRQCVGARGIQVTCVAEGDGTAQVCSARS